MTESPHPGQRREEPRQVVPATRVQWTSENMAWSCTGWVSDVATSSIAFVTPTRDKPVPGDAIELTVFAGSKSPRSHSLKVARTQEHDSLFTLVACQAADAV